MRRKTMTLVLLVAAALLAGCMRPTAPAAQRKCTPTTVPVDSTHGVQMQCPDSARP